MVYLEPGSLLDQAEEYHVLAGAAREAGHEQIARTLDERAELSTATASLIERHRRNVGRSDGILQGRKGESRG